MKQNISKNCIYASFLLVLCLLFTGCKDTDYRKACEQHDFEKAYKIIDKLDDSDKKKALHYTVLQEALYVIEQQGEAGMLRLGVIMKENKAYWLPSELLDIVKQTNDESLIAGIIKLDENSGYKIKPEDTSVQGVLNGYFEIVEDKCSTKEIESSFDDLECELTFTLRYIKAIPQKVLKQWIDPMNDMPAIDLYVDFFDKKGVCISGQDGDFVDLSLGQETSMGIEEIESLKIGDEVTKTISFKGDLLGRAKSFKLRSKKQ